MAAGTDVAIRHFVLGLILLKWRHKMVMRNPIHIAFWQALSFYDTDQKVVFAKGHLGCVGCLSCNLGE